MQPIIKVENVSKLYRLGEVGTGTISHDLNRWLARMKGKDDPFAKIGVENDRTKSTKDQYVWALKDINFEISKGDVVGIVGRNGAGKSTLLKILSKTTAPTSGEILVNGRIASLLEVGTGFHPELTGRENIFLNGAILGMRKNEIQKKLDAIVDFAGVAKYLDTPVKRYSSGMYVRLAFAVAAHLEPDILIVDEVLAVGDAEFQKKCLGKMKDVSNDEGRTILFVSHNMTAVKTLCDSCIWMNNGTIQTSGKTNSIIDKYLAGYLTATNSKEIDHSDDSKKGNSNVRLLRAKFDSERSLVRVSDDFSLYFEFESYLIEANINLSLVIYTREDVAVFNAATASMPIKKGRFFGRFYIPGNLLNDEFYYARILAVKDTSVPLIDIHNAISFEISDIERDGNWFGKWIGTIRPQLKWDLEQL